MEIVRKIQCEAAKSGSLTARQTAAPAVIPKGVRLPSARGAFTLIEVMVVVAIIGILSGLAYVSLMDLIFTNRAKETAQTLRTFTERALAEGKRMDTTVTVRISGNNIQYAIGTATPVNEPLSNGYSASSAAPTCESTSGLVSFNAGAKSSNTIGISSIAQASDQTKNQGYFTVCDQKGYCAATIKVSTKNAFIACIRRGTSANWEVIL